MHRARRENQGVLTDPRVYAALVDRLERIARKALGLLKALAVNLEEYVLTSGGGRNVIEREPERLTRAWGF